MNAPFKEKDSTHRYEYVVAWHERSGSMRYYIEEQVRRAREDSAPDRAIYRRDSGEWAVLGDVEYPLLRYQVAERARALRDA